MAATELTHDDVSERTDPKSTTLLGVGLGFVGVVLIARQKLFMGALSLIGGALIGLVPHQATRQRGAQAPQPAKAPTATKRAAAKPAAEKRTAAKPTAAKPTAAKPAAKKSTAAKPAAKGELKQIEGIGPKIAEVLDAAGIQGFAQLAEATPGRLREILAAAGNRYRIADPSTWPEQAALAAAGRWDDLKTLKGELKGGRRSG